MENAQDLILGVMWGYRQRPSSHKNELDEGHNDAVDKHGVLLLFNYGR